ncbi:AMP-binding protein [Bradyrhizobium sp. U87765 SZCCT0131]|uniref:AMP-binding protein n=1 Tax=unclassified Bradyrhizobium TaxID=2631580 RepID=UPI001BA81CC4|nr:MULTISPECIES: AMP-binding protein [unclassified Bradyrhizobium]MBR1221837.1 AMP-binding protein [Bradyrhizobium sp. U87765 SZCCT0131]MBR1263965.1 AMP-binding protein [Bradyrhizobium sp. U87765 SZCCT0134]MBR1308252.1 AMP-binding protein [Bradyrhizobium sp. U87765 SZCCT0110]MBR1320215.1 AMP-binding protein [Bradyrhizobium sp. U87765 SZCCT0109]MBR1348672.1 AMP-binding protein [Bradyrhizobium sp. U87765 SZCCT0048]
MATDPNLSHVEGDATAPLSDLTIFALLADTAARFPDRLAVVFREQGVRWTWRQFQAEVERFAAGLQALGLARGDRVGIWSPNRSEWLVTQFATARLGLILVNINPAYRLSELEYALRLSGCRAIISAEQLKTSKYLEMLATVRPQLPALQWIIRLGDGETPDMLRYADVMARGEGVRIVDQALGCHDPINIQFTSGTTGNPKGATLTHHNVVNNARFIARAMTFSEIDRLCIPVPLYHCFGMVLSVLACVSAGATMVFPGEAFDPGAALAAVAEERCTALHGVPTMFIAELAHPDFRSFDLSSLRTGIMAGSPCPIETMKQVVAQMNMSEVTIAYGMTETSPVSFQSSTTDPMERRVTTVGRIQPRLEAKVIDAEGNVLPRGATGELCVRGYSVMQGYWEDPARTAEVVRDGWMHTGDLATIDDEGYCNIVGRAKDMLIRGGENVYPREIEEFLFRFPKVQSVQVFGVPDTKYGEEICAWIVLKPGESSTAEEIRDFCRDQIAHYKIPRYVRFVDEMPMTVTGKFQKFVMRDHMIDELNLGEIRTA